MWFFSMNARRWAKNPQQPEGGISTREAVYLPDQDAVLAYGPATEDDPVHKVAVLLWPPRFEQDIRPHLFRLDLSQVR